MSQQQTLYGNSTAATLASLLAAGQQPQLRTGLVDADDPFALDPDPFGGMPDGTVTGFPLTTISAQVDICFHAVPNARTVYLVTKFGSVVRYMQDVLGFPPDRLAATGFGEYRPVATGDDEVSRALNRRIELKLTER